ncbi:cell division protein ZapA [Rhodospirillaceae bacterium SYSU D60014]|uniref:cell division protein ZapA n=1 Tax=Virgifigura deserti TaxID=2268457 RepID=UPI000E6709A8
MPTVPLVVNGRSYDVACGEGQEEHLRVLGSAIAQRVDDLVASLGQIGENRLLLMAGLLIADELSESYKEVARLQSEAGDRSTAGEDALADAIERLAERIEGIAARLESA